MENNLDTNQNSNEKANPIPKRILFIDRDGVLIKEPPDHQIDAFEKLEFCPGLFTYLGKIAAELNFELMMVTNQDGLGTTSFPEKNFWPVQHFIMNSLQNEGIHFSKIFIDRSFEKDKLPSRKPGTAMLSEIINNADYDVENSFVIGDRLSDMQLAKNLGCKGLWLNGNLIVAKIVGNIDVLRENVIVLETNNWVDIYQYLKLPARKLDHNRNTNETKIAITINLDGTGKSSINTGIAFFDHMIDQLSRHGNIDLTIDCKGDLQIDEHHTIEDIGITLGEAMAKALGDKRGIERYGFLLPMDDCLAQVAIDFGGRNWIVWDADFKREKIGEMPTEMFFHFFKSFSDAAKCNLNIVATGQNEHHKIEAIFKAFAKAIKMAVKRDLYNNALPTTKGIL